MKTNRRDFLKLSAAATVAPMLWLPRRAYAASPGFGLAKHVLVLHAKGGIRSHNVFNAVGYTSPHSPYAVNPFGAEAAFGTRQWTLGSAAVRNKAGAMVPAITYKDAQNNVTTFAWDSATQTTTVTDARSNVWKDVYQNGVLFKRIDAQSNTTQFGFDSGVNETSVTGPDGNQVALGYDSKGNLTSATSAALNATKTVTYNSRNDIATITDARGKVTT